MSLWDYDIFDDPADFSGKHGREANQKILEAQGAASERAMAAQKEMFNTIREDYRPWREAGGRAIGKMEDADFQRDFTMADYQADPGYMFRMEEGQKALERSASARGQLMGGGFAKELTRYGQGVASDEYSKAYDRFNADRDRRFNRLASISGQGQTATTATSAAGQSYANNASALHTDMGNSYASKVAADENNRSKRWDQMSSIGSMFMMCDERLKTDIRPLTKEQAREIRAAVRPYFFHYKDEAHGKGEFVAPMAQDLEKCEHAKHLVIEDAQGNKQVDIGRAVMLLLALEGVA